MKHLSQFLTLRRCTVSSGGYYQHFRPSLKRTWGPLHNPCSRWTSENWPLGILQTLWQGKGAFSAFTSLVLAESPSWDKSSGWHVSYRNCSLCLVIQESRCPFFTKWLGWERPSLHLSRETTLGRYTLTLLLGQPLQALSTQGRPQVPVSWQVWKTVSFQPTSLDTDIDILFWKISNLQKSCQYNTVQKIP